MLYNQTEFYVQDNWKVTSRLTLDYGMRFVNQQPQYDQFGQQSNFFPDKWKASDAQVLYVAGCSNGAVSVYGQHPQRDGSAHTGRFSRRWARRTRRRQSGRRFPARAIR